MTNVHNFDREDTIFTLMFFFLQLMGAEKKLRHENEDLKCQIKKMQENEKRDRRKLAEDEAILKIQKMEKTISDLSKNLNTQKQVEHLFDFNLNSFI